jgi:hypothetical protein
VRLAYLAHPIGAPSPGEVLENVARARRWLRYLARQAFLKDEPRIFVAPYLEWIGALDEHDPEARKCGIRWSQQVAGRCDEFWPVGRGDLISHQYGGGRWSLALTTGMAAEFRTWQSYRSPPLVEVGLRRDYLFHEEPPEAP